MDEGLEIVDRFLEKYPDHWNLLHFKGLVLYKKENYTEALEFLRTGWENKLFIITRCSCISRKLKKIASLNQDESEES